jgi:hypothetical protein
MERLMGYLASCPILSILIVCIGSFNPTYGQLWFKPGAGEDGYKKEKPHQYYLMRLDFDGMANLVYECW